MAIQFEVSALIPASPETLYRAWLNSREHSRMTGGKAKVAAEAGGAFQAWDGYIQGRNLELEPDRRIVQSWRTGEFEAGDADSQVEVTFERAGDQTRVTIRHTGLPDDGGHYEQGWVEYYFDPMKAYFEGQGDR